MGLLAGRNGRPIDARLLPRSMLPRSIDLAAVIDVAAIIAAAALNELTSWSKQRFFGQYDEQRR
jgi:hypothetical protein